MALGDAETVDFRVVLVLRSLRERGLKVPSPHDPEGVVAPVPAPWVRPLPRPTTPRAWSWTTGDAHAGIRAAVRAILPGAAWQRCRAPLRPQHHHPGWARPAPEPAGALVSTIFAQTSQEAVAAQYKHVIDALRDPFPSESPRC